MAFNYWRRNRKFNSVEQTNPDHLHRFNIFEKRHFINLIIQIEPPLTLSIAACVCSFLSIISIIYFRRLRSKWRPRLVRGKTRTVTFTFLRLKRYYFSRLSHRSQKAKHSTKKIGDCKAFFTLLKSFLGTGLLLMAKGFTNGGWSFSVPCLVIAGVISGVCAAMLIETRKKVRGSFSEIAAYTFGF